MNDVFTVQVLEPFHDLDRVNSHQCLVELAEPVQDLPQGAPTDHFKDQVNLVFAIPLEVVVLHDVRMLETFQKIDFILNNVQLAPTLLGVCLRRQGDALDGEEPACLQVKSCVDFAKSALPDQVVLLVMNERLLPTRG